MVFTTGCSKKSSTPSLNGTTWKGTFTDSGGNTDNDLYQENDVITFQQNTYTMTSSWTESGSSGTDISSGTYTYNNSTVSFHETVYDGQPSTDTYIGTVSGKQMIFSDGNGYSVTFTKQ